MNLFAKGVYLSIEQKYNLCSWLYGSEICGSMSKICAWKNCLVCCSLVFIAYLSYYLPSPIEGSTI
ncbi:hypothetical protein CSPX01_10995 [Colletotrichum filicis]|nr:hypothetical protein CSPX01_10995 [Colletotrichum filicis]